MWWVYIISPLPLSPPLNLPHRFQSEGVSITARDQCRLQYIQYFIRRGGQTRLVLRTLLFSFISLVFPDHLTHTHVHMHVSWPGLKKFSNWPTYPQLYVNGELVGGLDILQVHCVVLALFPGSLPWNYCMRVNLSKGREPGNKASIVLHVQSQKNCSLAGHLRQYIYMMCMVCAAGAEGEWGARATHSKGSVIGRQVYCVWLSIHEYTHC